MRLRLVVVGRAPRGPWQALYEDYERRIRRYVPFEVVRLRDAPEPKLQEALRRRDVVGGRDRRARLVVLAVEGEPWSTQRLVRLLDEARHAAVARLDFLVGGAYGLPRAVVQGADHRWSLGPLTLPHRLARLVVVEQLYRALTLLHGEPYAH